MAIKKKTKKDRLIVRVYLEARLIGRIIYESTYKDAREIIAGSGIKWRQLYDKKHKVIWRALEKLDLKTLDERMKTIEEEAYADPEAYPAIADMDDVPGWDRVWGFPGSIAAREFKKKLIKESRGHFWLQRELEKTGALRLAGGKEYLRELEKIGENEIMSIEDLLRDIKKGLWL